MALVYTATCQVTSKVYVGITSRTLKERVRKHVSKARRGSKTYFHKALRKYGALSFTWSIYEEGLSWEAACSLEKAIIQERNLCNHENGYNITKGGEGSLGVAPSTEIKDRIRASLKAWHASEDPEARALRAKVSAIRQGSKASFDTRKKLAGALRGRVLSEESRQKLSASKMQYPESTRNAAVEYALEHGYHAAERFFDIPRPTIRRWSKLPEERVGELARMRKRNRERQYGYAFPIVSPD